MYIIIIIMIERRKRNFYDDFRKYEEIFSG